MRRSKQRRNRNKILDELAELREKVRENERKAERWQFFRDSGFIEWVVFSLCIWLIIFVSMWVMNYFTFK